jgi:hypothetical protein
MPTPLPNYQSYKGIPPLAGVCTFEEAMKPGMSIDECVTRLKRIHYCFVRLHEILTARITSEPIYELKTAYAYHAYLCAEHVTALRTRIGEMREPPLGLEEVPHRALEVFFDEIRACPTTVEFVNGVYGFTLDALLLDLQLYLIETNPLTDAPSRRVLEFTLYEFRKVKDFANPTIASLGKSESYKDWKKSTLVPLYESMGGITGYGSGMNQGDNLKGFRRYSSTPHTPSPIPQRDERFTDLWNQGVNAEAFLYSAEQSPRDKVLMMLFKRIREIDVPEMMATIITETKGKPWGYYRDMSRQVWDEARHAMMGEVGFVALGVDWTKAHITWNWSYRLNTECTPLERHGVLFFIEQGLMPKTGKRYEWEMATDSGIPLAKTMQDFDWADEVLHSHIGRQWYVTQFGSLKEALDFGDKAWSKILSNWATVKEQGLTQHENWWPAIYVQACKADGREPDPKVLAYNETYEGKRADLRGVVGE